MSDMPNIEARRARARLAAYRRWRTGDDLDRLTIQCLREIEVAGIDAKIDDLVADAPRMTSAQVARIRRWANAEPPEQAAETAAS